MNDIPYADLRYDQVRQKASHNSPVRTEGVYDQALYWQIRSFEFDLHRGDAPGQWLIYHQWDVLRGSSVHDLDAMARLLAALHATIPEHEVITVFLEIAADGDFDSTHTPEQLDRTLTSRLGGRALYQPEDLLAATGKSKLRDAAQAGWPRLATLRGRFLFVLNRSGRSTYCGNNGDDANRRVCFFADEVGSLADIGDRDYIAFYNLSFSNRAFGPTVRERGFVSRIYPDWHLVVDSLETAEDWAQARDAKVNLIASDSINALWSPFARTDTLQGFPFEGLEAGVEPEAAEPRQARGACVGNAFAPEAGAALYLHDRRAPGTATDLRASIAVPGSHTTDSSRFGLMARADTADDSPYFAVLRPGGGTRGGLFASWRRQRGGPIETASVPIAPPATIDEYACPFVRLQVAADGLGAVGLGAAFAQEPGAWVEIARQAFDEPLVLVGLAAFPGHAALVDVVADGLDGCSLAFGLRARIGPLLRGVGYAGTYPPRVTVAAVTSLAAPMPELSRRSSGDFSMQTALPATRFLSWNVTSRRGSASIRFDVKRDVSVGEDVLVFEGLRLASRIVPDDHRKLYVDRPRYAQYPFVAELQAVGAFDYRQERPADLPLAAAVVSDGSRQPGQAHRSSGDFSVQSLPDATRALAWYVWSESEMATVSFNVMRDVAGDADPVVWRGIVHRGLTLTEHKELDRIRTLYIADPEGIDANAVFAVTVYPLTDVPPLAPTAASVGSAGQPEHGQKHRSSPNFSLSDVPEDAIALVWQVSDHPQPDGLSFTVRHDHVGGDTTEFKDVRNASWTRVDRYAKVYIADPAGTDGLPFRVTVRVVTKTFPT